MTPTAPGSQGYVAEVVQREEDFAALRATWHSLYLAAPRATPFQTYAWLESWWRAYGEPGRLRVLLVRDPTGKVVAVAPFHVRRRGATRTLTAMGGAISDYADVLVAESALAPERVPDVVSALVDGLAATRGWDVLDLPEVRPGGMAEQLFGSWPGPRWCLESSTCTELRAATFEQLLSRLPSKRASEIRRRLRRADELGLEVTAVPADEVTEGVADLIRLHARQWEGRGVNREHLRERFSTHLRRALTTMITDGEASLTRVRLDGDVVAVTLDLIGHQMVCGYLTGVSPELYRRIDVTAFILRNEWQRMSPTGCSVFSMLRGRETYKHRWRPDVVVNQRLLMVRPGAPLARASSLGLVSAARAADIARRRAPQLRELRRSLAPRP